MAKGKRGKGNRALWCLGILGDNHCSTLIVDHDSRELPGTNYLRSQLNELPRVAIP